MLDFVHLHVHTYYSILDGAASVKRLVDKAIADGQKGMAITDHGNMFGIKEFFDYCNKVNKERKQNGEDPFTPIFGCEVYVAQNDKESKEKEKGDNIRYHLILLAKNETGYHNLVKLVSEAWTDGFYNKARTDHKGLEKYHEGLICSSACLAGEVAKAITQDDIEKAEKTVLWYKKLFGDDYYLEIMRHEVTDPAIRANRETYEMQKKVNPVIIELARKHNIKVICTNDSHFVNEEDAEAHDRLLCVNTGQKHRDENRMLYTKQEWFKTRDEMEQIFSDIPEALTNTMDILGKVETYDIEHKPILPDFPLPEGFTDEDEYLKFLTYNGAKERYGDPIPDDIKTRIDFELDTIKTMGFPGYFLIVQDYIHAAREKLGVWVGPGRGSAAGSVVSYCLDITRLDPLKYDLLFERFLNPDRISLPDIDVDFDDDGRAAVLQYVTEKYGAERVAHIITYGTMATKNAIKDVARVEDVPLDTVNRICKAIPDREFEINEKDEKGKNKTIKVTVRNVVEHIVEAKEAAESPDDKLRNTMKYAAMLENNVRGTGLHACGVIICGDDIVNWVPVSTAEDKETKERVRCTQYDGHVIESTGLIKMDFLGLKTLSILKEACENIKESLDIDIDIDNIDIKDELTYNLFSEGKTIGTFQFESPGMRKYLRELKPSKFEDLIAMNALYRPGPMDYIPAFIKRKHGKEKIEYDLPEMEEYLKDTYGVTVYQEQVMLLSRKLANFTRGQSDTLRKAMGKKKIEEMSKLKVLFLEGGKKNGYDEKKLEKIWTDWRAFASYAFNKSHAACYSWIAYQTAYLKAHYPSQYMAAVMSRSLADISEVSKLMDECKSMKIDTLGPDVNESRRNFSVNSKNQIRFGLAAIKGMGNAAADSIIEEREKNGPYKDIFDFVQRINLNACNRRCMEALVYSGGLDSFGIRREQYFGISDKRRGEMFIDALIQYGNRYQTALNEESNSLFGSFDSIEIATPMIPEVEEWSSLARLNKERELIGIYLSAHPLDNFTVVMEKMCNTSCSDLGDPTKLENKQVVKFGGIVTDVEDKITQKGKPYGRVTIEDFDGSGRFSIFGQSWLDKKKNIAIGYSIFVKGRYGKAFQWSTDNSLVIDSVQLLSDSDSNASSITISVNALDINDNLVGDIIELAEEHKGNVPLYFNIVDTQRGQTIRLHSISNKVKLTRPFIDYLKKNTLLEYTIE